MYLHLTTCPLVKLQDSYPGANYKVRKLGKPIGLWYAKDRDWINLLDKNKTWMVTPGNPKQCPFPKVAELYERVLSKQALPPGDTGDGSVQGPGSCVEQYAYNFPLESSFLDTVAAPDPAKIFNMTSTTIPQFESAFRPYLLGEFYRYLIDRDVPNPYDIVFEDGLVRLTPEQDQMVQVFLDSKGIAGTKRGPKGVRVNAPLNKRQCYRYLVRAFMVRELLKAVENGPITLDVPRPREYFMEKKSWTPVEVTKEKITAVAPFKTPKEAGFTGRSFEERDINGYDQEITGDINPIGFDGYVSFFDGVRNLEYGNFLSEKMQPVWGGIHYDASLFTPELQAAYPFIQYVEVPSGCLWKPTRVLAGYTPAPIAVVAIANTQEEADTITKRVVFAGNPKTIARTQGCYEFARNSTTAKSIQGDVVSDFTPVLTVAGIKDGELFAFEKKPEVIAAAVAEADAAVGGRRRRKTRRARNRKRALRQTRSIYR
jgi:hypothetical protein